MFRYTISLLTFLLFNVYLSAQSTWSMVFPDIISAGTGTVTEVIQCPNGDLLTAGGNLNMDGEAVAFLMRISPSGSLIWYKEYEGFHSFVSLINLPSGEFMAGGRAHGSWYTSSILRADSAGNVLQSVYVECDCSGNATSLAKSENGFIGLGGFVWEIDETLTNINWVSRLQPNGMAYDIEEIPGGFILAGFGGNISQANYPNVHLTKIDSLGNHQWGKTYGGINNDYGMDVQPTKDKGFLIGGTAEPILYNHKEFLLIKTDSLGNYQWGKSYGSSSYNCGANTVLEDKEGNFYIGGGRLFNEIMIVKTDTAGDLIWSKSFGYGTAYSMIETIDGNIVVAGETEEKEYFVFKMDTSGNALCSQNITIEVNNLPFVWGNSSEIGLGIVIDVYQDTLEMQSYSKDFNECQYVDIGELSAIQTKPLIEVYPNPVSDLVHFNFSSVGQINSIEIYSLNGKLVQEVQIGEGQKQRTLSLINFPEGMYIYQLISHKGETYAGKLSVSR